MLTVETPVWESLDVDDLHVLHASIDGLAVNAHGAAIRVDRATPSVGLVSRRGLSAATSGRDTRHAAGLVSIQARLSLRAWSLVEEALGPVAFDCRGGSPHPRRGPRADLSDALALPERLIFPRGGDLRCEGAGHLRATADELVAPGVGHAMRRGDGHL